MNLIVDVSAFKVIPAPEEDHKVVLAHVSSQVPEPIVRVRAIDPEELKL